MSEEDQQQMFTCVACSVAFRDSAVQREHFKTEFHRYNMKRRIADLPSVTLETFHDKIADRLQQVPAVAAKSASGTAASSAGGHLSARGREKLQKKLARANENNGSKPESVAPSSADSSFVVVEALDIDPSAPSTSASASSSNPIPATATITATATATVTSDVSSPIDIDAEIKARTESKLRIQPLECLFASTCGHFSDIAQLEQHLGSAHICFLPERKYLQDPAGLIAYLADKISVGFTCITCNKSFLSVESTRKHMLAKVHTKIAYDTEAEKLECSDFYDFISSYSAKKSRKRHAILSAALDKVHEDDHHTNEGWEDDDDMVIGEEDEVIVIDHTVGLSDSGESSDFDEVDSDLVFGDTPYELVLPSGATIGHRSLRNVYKQSPTVYGTMPSSKSARAAQRLINAKGSDLILARGGTGRNDAQVQRARNAGEARHARDETWRFRQLQAQERHRTKVGMIANSQKHFRDRLLQ